MRVQPTAAEVRQIVVRTFENLWGDDSELAKLEENILIDDGRYIGRSYRAVDLFAMWMARSRSAPVLRRGRQHAGNGEFV